MLYSQIDKPIIISSDSFVFFITLMLHKTINPVLDAGSVGLIYSFRKEGKLSNMMVSSQQYIKRG